MKLSELTTPMETHKIIRYAKDGNTVVHRNCKMQHITGPLYKGLDTQNKWYSEFEVYVIYDGWPAGLLFGVYRVDAELTVEGTLEIAKKNHLDTLNAYLQRLEVLMKASDFIGHAEIECVRLFDPDLAARLDQYRAEYDSRKAAEHAAEKAKRETEAAAYVEEKNAEAEAAVQRAIEILRSGGDLENVTVSFFRSRYSMSNYSVVNYLMRKYGIKVPLRTQGWINESLIRVTIDADGHWKSYGRRVSDSKVFGKYIEKLAAAVRARPKEEGEPM